MIRDSLDGIEERYILEGHLGSGTFGEVRLCREIATGDMYAAKIIDLKQIHYRVGFVQFVVICQEDKIKVILREAEMLASLHHPGIPFMKEIVRGKVGIPVIRLMTRRICTLSWSWSRAAISLSAS